MGADLFADRVHDEEDRHHFEINRSRTRQERLQRCSHGADGLLESMDVDVQRFARIGMAIARREDFAHI